MRWVAENSMPKRAAKPSSVALNGMPKKRRARNAGDAVRPAGDRLPVDQHEADDLAERERDDGEIVAAQPQHRKAEQHAPECGEDAGERQADPERQIEGGRQQRVGIGADRVEGDVAEVEQAGEADHDVQSPAEHHVGQHQDAEVEHVALIVEDDRNEQREAEQGGRDQALRRPPAAVRAACGTRLAGSRWRKLCRSSSTRMLPPNTAATIAASSPKRVQ